MRKKLPYDGHNRKPKNHAKLARHRYNRRHWRGRTQVTLRRTGGELRY